MSTFLQVWGSLFYLLNKFFLARAENNQHARPWRISGWIVYLIGLPAWIIVLVLEHNWMASATAVGGAPAMFLGLVIAVKGIEFTPKILQKSAEYVVYAFVIMGVMYSMYDYGGLTAWSQVLEIGVLAGFLAGSYLLAKKNPSGWLWFALMNLSMGTLMAIQYRFIFAGQQILSLGFVAWGYTRSQKKSL